MDWLPSAEKLLFDPVNQQLFTEQGVFLKKLFCPISEKEDETRSAPSKELCPNCGQRSVHAADYDGQQLYALLLFDPELCIQVCSNSIKTLTTTPNDVKRIQLITRLSVMNRAVEQGFQLFLQRAVLDPILTPLSAYQDHASGHVFIEHHHETESQYLPSSAAFLLSRNELPHADSPFLVAYIIPPDLQPGDKVELVNGLELETPPPPEPAPETDEEWYYNRSQPSDTPFYRVSLYPQQAVWTGKHFRLPDGTQLSPHQRDPNEPEPYLGFGITPVGTCYDLRLTSFGNQSNKVLKRLQNLFQLVLQDSNELDELLPIVIPCQTTQENTEIIQQRLQALGLEVELILS
mgnify:CR=1 FL=1